ncbi:MAG: curli assembly protein CsgF [Bacteroidetes bacterium]|nr:curli assembly protein CsgF [Fibrella sp.]
MKKFVHSFMLLLAAGTCSYGQAFVYRPVNPNFGGNTFNYSWLLSSAQAQDRTTDPAAARRQTTTRTQTSALDNFSQSIQNQLLSRLTRNLVSDQFGEGELKEGTYTFGDYQVEIRNGAEGVIVRIVDGQGGETSITVPYF